MIYLDNSSTTKPLDEVCLAIDHANRLDWSNPASMHQLGHLVEKKINNCKKELAGLLACETSEITFSSCGTESTNTVLKGFWEAYPRAGRHMITSAGEHHATLETCRYLEKKGIEVDYIPLNIEGSVDFDLLIKKIRPETSIISLIHVNNETGAILDVARLVQIKNQLCPKALLHLDCVQSFGKIDAKIGRLGVDYTSVSGHKIHGPKGIGILYHKKSAKISPLIHGGGQQQGLRSGTENLPLIEGMVLATKLSYSEIEESYKKVCELKNLLLDEFKKYKFGFRINSPSEGSPYILNVSFPGVKAQTLLHTLESLGVYVSTLSACSSRKQKISHVLLAMGIEPEIAKSSIRISFSRFNTKNEIIQAARIIDEAVRKLVL